MEQRVQVWEEKALAGGAGAEHLECPDSRLSFPRARFLARGAHQRSVNGGVGKSGN